MGRWSRRLAPLFIDFAGIVAAGRVLDVGCGTGSLSFCLARNPGIVEVEGLDFSPAYIDHAKRQNGDPRLNFRVGNACALPFPIASFDHTLAMLVLQFIPDACQSAFKFDPVSASNFAPFERRFLTVALASSELVGVAETGRARVA